MMTNLKNSVTLRMPGQRPGRTFVVARAALIEEIVCGRSVPPEAQILFEGCFIPLRDCPEAPWLDELARQAIAAATRREEERLSALVEKILRYGGDQDDREPVGLAKFLKAHLCLGEGNYHEAIALLQPAARKPSLVRAAACNNLGVAWIGAKDPVAALIEFEAAVATDAGLLVAHMNLRALASRMLFERAPDLAGRLSWSEMYRQADASLRQVPAFEIRAFINGDRPFPGHQVLHLLTFSPESPRLSAAFPISPSAEPAARHLLQLAHIALTGRNYPQAKLLASKATSVCPPLQAEARELITAANQKIEEATCQEQTSQYARKVANPEYVAHSFDTATREKIARVADDLARGDMDGAQQHLPEVLSAGAPPRLVAELKTTIAAGKLLQQSQECLAANDQPGALRCLRRAIALEPRCRDALQQILGLELLLRRSLARPALQEAAEAGQEAIEAFLAGDRLRCQSACEGVLRVLKSSHLVSHLHNALAPTQSSFGEGHRP